MQPTSVLATVTGRDRPGVIAAFFAALSAHDVDVRDVDLVVIRDRLILVVLFDLRGDQAALRRSVTRTAHALGMGCDITMDDGPERQSSGGTRSHVIILGRPLRAGALSHVAQRIADIGDNIESVAQLANEPVSSVEMIVHSVNPAQLRAILVQAADDTGVDVAIEPAEARRAPKRLVALDVDSMLIRDEAIAILAERAGVGQEVTAITERAMAGELESSESLRARARARVQVLAGVPFAEVEAVRDGLRLTPGAKSFVTTLRRLGYRVGVVSGGFTVFTDRFVAELELDFAVANELEIIDGTVTGNVVGPILDRAGKSAALERIAVECGVPLSQTVAVGGADIEMIEAAGLGIALNAKSALRAAADPAVRPPFLDSVLFVLGIGREQIQELEELSR